MGLKLKYSVKNVGCISTAHVTVKPLTVIAGVNSSGKTFLTKSFYTILYSVYTNHFTKKLFEEYQFFWDSYKEFYFALNNKSIKDKEIYNCVENFFQRTFVPLYIHLAGSKFSEEEKILSEYRPEIDKLYTKIDEYFENKLKYKKYKKIKNKIDKVYTAYEKFISVYSHRKDILAERLKENITTGFKENYQITKLETLCNRSTRESAKFIIDSLGELEISRKGELSFSFLGDGIDRVQKVRNIIFFDSPVYLKIRKALDRNRNYLIDLIANEKNYLKGYPGYVGKLYDFINKEYTEEPDLKDISEKIQKIISGKFKLNETGDIQYEDNENNIVPLTLTAMGIGNFGLIDLLIRNNVINKGSFLIMDEPEVHLHPEWQVLLAQILYEIAKSGANIIIATHSLDMIKAFQKILKHESEEAEKIISINKMPYSDSFNKKSELEKIDILLDDLSKPYYNLYMEDFNS